MAPGQIQQAKEWVWKQIPVKRQLTSEEVYSVISYSTHIVWNRWLCNIFIADNVVLKQKATHKSRELLYWLAILPKLSKIVDCLTIFDKNIFIVDNVVLKQLHNNWQDVILLIRQPLFHTWRSYWSQLIKVLTYNNFKITLFSKG